MNTPATQPTNVDKKLEELVARTTEFCGCDTNKDVALCVHDTEAMGEVERIALPVIAALIRARQALVYYSKSSIPRATALKALADPELEELLR